MENRLQAIYDAAGSLFINKGYKRTQIKDIAKEIGLSAGMIYVYFKGKQEILQFILKETIAPGFIGQEFEYPIDGRQFGGLTAEIIAALEQNHQSFSRPLQNGTQGYSFSQMLSDAFDTIARYATGCLILEKNIDDAGELGTYYIRYRKAFFGHILAYLDHYLASGEIRKMPHPELAAQQIIETLAWWGMHVRHDAFETNKMLDVSLAKEVCMDNLLHAYAHNA